MITLSKDFDFQLSEEVDRYFNRNNWNGRFRKFKESHKESSDKAIAYMQKRGISEAVCREYEITSKDKQPEKHGNGILSDDTLVFDDSDFELAKSQHCDLQNYCNHRCDHRAV